MSITFTNLSNGNEIGSNSYLLQMGGTRIALDAGMHPKHEGLDTLPDFGLIPPGELDAIFLSHAHLDHSGTLPVLMRQQPMARVFMTEATRMLADALLHNSVNVMSAKREELDIYDYPFYSHFDLDELFPAWEAVTVGRPFHFSSRDEVTCELHHAGHILGAAAAQFRYNGKSVLYTGDIHFEEQTLTKGAVLPEEGIDTIIVETTRGGVARRPDYTRQSEIDRLAECINRVMDKGGSVLIPVFAMGKTQELMLMLHELKQKGVIPNAPVHMGGLSTKMTTIYDRLSRRTRRNFEGLRILEEIDIVMASSRKRRKQLEYNPRCIYALSSGMMSEKTMSSEFAKYIVSNPKCGLFFVGYADPDSPAGHLLQTNNGDEIQLTKNSEPRQLLCEVDKFDFSGHATRDSILEYLVKLKPENIVLVHGDTDALEWFKGQLATELPDANVIIPPPGEPIDLS